MKIGLNALKDEETGKPLFLFVFFSNEILYG